MARFKFKLAAVLRHREILEQGKQREYALAAGRVKELEDQLAALNQDMRTTSDDVRENHLVGRLDVHFITAHRRYLAGMQRRAMDLVTAIAGARRQAEVARAALAEAAKQRKILEKLRETQQGRWRDEQSRKEMIAADESAMQVFNDGAARGRALPAAGDLS